MLRGIDMVGLHGGNIKEIAEKYQLMDHELIDFSANINPLGVSQKLLDSFDSEMKQILHYPDLRYKELTNEISKYHQVNAENIYLGNGAADVIYSLADCLNINKLLVLAPTFSEYEDAFAHKNTKFVYFETAKTNFNVDVDNLIDTIKSKRVDGVCLCNPNNPTGKLIEKKEMLKIAEYCQEYKVKLIIDEAFMDFVSEEESLSTELNHYSDLFILRSLTKIFAIPGLRLGYLLTENKKVLENLEKKAVPWRINCFADLAGRESLKDKDYLEETIHYVSQERLFLEKELFRFKSIHFVESTCNFIFFSCELEVNLQEKLLKKNILIRDCSNYKGLDDNYNYYRIAVRTHKENEQLIAAFEEYFNGKNHC